MLILLDYARINSTSFFLLSIVYGVSNNVSDPNYLDRQVWANSVDSDETTQALIRVYTVCHSN